MVRQTSLLFQQIAYRTSLGLIRGVLYLTEMLEILKDDVLCEILYLFERHRREKYRPRGGARCMQSTFVDSVAAITLSIKNHTNNNIIQQKHL